MPSSLEYAYRAAPPARGLPPNAFGPDPKKAFGVLPTPNSVKTTGSDTAQRRELRESLDRP